ncbi:c-type cytochrome [Oceanisphaera arctica]|uniref:Cytochrome C n=1 Tax=Oceanisphaera arctica TaxID=641510 RepID=A0A2P5TRA9_9GAMM|nr:cytochrome c [Oceanisphaera arctica]PPL18321.1 cytochrome C [Oceanisphaera arctica]
MNKTSRPTRWWPWAVAVVVLAPLVMVGSHFLPGDLSVGAEQIQRGKQAYNENCASCHGADLKGTRQGPPFIHKVYEPSHHGDEAFYRAAANGVRAHHWRFGDMPPVPGATREEVGDIIAYIRDKQRQHGIE